MRNLTKESEELLKLAIRELGQQSDYAGFTAEETKLLADKISSLDKNKPAEIRPEHLAEAIQYGSNINVFIGRELTNIIEYCGQNNIILPAMTEKHFERMKYSYERIKEVFGIDIKPILLKETSEINLGKYGKKLSSWKKTILFKQVNKFFVK
jgi:hypothetical protein